MVWFALWAPLLCSTVTFGASSNKPPQFGTIKHDYEEIKHGLKALNNAFVAFPFTNGTIVEVTRIGSYFTSVNTTLTTTSNNLKDSSIFLSEQAENLTVSFEAMVPLVSSVADHAIEKHASFSQLGQEIITFLADEIAQLAADFNELSYEFANKCPLEIEDEVETTGRSIEAAIARVINVLVP